MAVLGREAGAASFWDVRVPLSEPPRAPVSGSCSCVGAGWRVNCTRQVSFFPRSRAQSSMASDDQEDQGGQESTTPSRGLSQKNASWRASRPEARAVAYFSSLGRTQNFWGLWLLRSECRTGRLGAQETGRARVWVSSGRRKETPQALQLSRHMDLSQLWRLEAPGRGALVGALSLALRRPPPLCPYRAESVFCSRPLVGTQIPS